MTELGADDRLMLEALGARLLLERPLCLVDTETTGTSVERDRVVELAVVKVTPVPGSYQATAWASLIDPGQPIPAEATAVHGIGDVDVRGAPTFAQKAAGLARGFRGCDLLAFNAAFDVGILAAEFARAGIAPWPEEGTRVVDPMRIYHRVKPRDLAAAVRAFCDRDHRGAHRALADAVAAGAVLSGQLGYSGSGQTVPHEGGLPALLDWLRDPRAVDDDGKLVWIADGEAAIAFGKHQGRTLRALAAGPDREYLEWIAYKAQGFSAAVRRLAAEALAGRFPQKEAT